MRGVIPNLFRNLRTKFGIDAVLKAAEGYQVQHDIKHKTKRKII